MVTTSLESLPMTSTKVAPPPLTQELSFEAHSDGEAYFVLTPRKDFKGFPPGFGFPGPTS